MRNLGAACLAFVLALLGGLAGNLAQAQAPAKADSAAEAAAAMERAQRLASNPMRVILAAGKFRRKGAVDEVPPEPADAASLRRTSTLGPGGTEMMPALARPPTPDAVGTPAPAVLPRPAQAEPVIGVTSSSLAAPQEAVPALESSGAAMVTIAPLPQAAAALTATVATRPRLVESVEPVFGGRLIDEAARLTEVLAELTISPDGGVVQAVLLDAVPRALQRPIIAALEQWRFAPMPAQQMHRVQLVFGGR